MDLIKSPVFSQPQRAGEHQDIEPKRETRKGQRISLSVAVDYPMPRAVFIWAAISTMHEKENLMEGDDFPFIERTATPQITSAEGTIQDFGTENELCDFTIHFGGSHLEPPFPHNVFNDVFISFSV
jgi:hypothetical protein